MFGDMQAMEPCGVRGRDEFQSLVELRGKGAIFRALQMVEQSYSHFLMPLGNGGTRILSPPHTRLDMIFLGRQASIVAGATAKSC